MKALSLLLAGCVLCFNLSACGKKEVARNKVPTGSPTIAPFDVPASPSPARTPSQAISVDPLAFHRDQGNVPLSSALTIAPKEFKENNKTLKFEVYVSFPQIQKSTKSAQKRFNWAVENLARNQFNDYKKRQLRPMSNKERFPHYHEDVVEFLYIDYDIPFAAEDLISVRFYASTYGRGAAHAVDYFFVFNYDLKSGREVKLSTLFRPQVRYLSVVSKYSADVVKKRIRNEGGWGSSQTFEGCLKSAQLWEEGIKPTRENFKAWNFTREGLLFSFDPCQLTGCAGGEFYVNVPYSEIIHLMKSNVVTSRISAP